MIVAGLDPGFSGAIAVINGYGDCETCDMPVTGEDKLRRISAPRVSEFLHSRDVEFAVIELVNPSPAFGCHGNFKFGGAFFDLLGVLDMLAIPFEPVRSPVWKKAMGVTKDKNTSRRRATELFPRAYQQFERAKDDGRAEAALLAAWWLQRAKSEAA